MSTTSHNGRSAHGIQSKFEDCGDDQGKNPAGLMVWLTLVSGVVSTHGQDVSGGAPLENLIFLDHNLDRRKGYVSTKQAFLDDPDLQLPDDTSNSFLGSPGRSNDTGSSRPSSEPPDASLEQSRAQAAGNRDAVDLYDQQMNPKRYQDLQPDAQRLDRQLFQTLQTIVKGNLVSVISQLTGQHACYTFSIIAIWRNHRLSSATRKHSVMTRMQELQYHGDASKWKLGFEFIERAAEVFQSQVTLEYWMMNCAFRLFEGTTTQIQSMIVEDINNKDAVCARSMSWYACCQLGKQDLVP